MPAAPPQRAQLRHTSPGCEVAVMREVRAAGTGRSRCLFTPTPLPACAPRHHPSSHREQYHGCWSHLESWMPGPGPAAKGVCHAGSLVAPSTVHRVSPTRASATDLLCCELWRPSACGRTEKLELRMYHESMTAVRTMHLLLHGARARSYTCKSLSSLPLRTHDFFHPPNRRKAACEASSAPNHRARQREAADLRPPPGVCRRHLSIVCAGKFICASDRVKWHSDMHLFWALLCSPVTEIVPGMTTPYHSRRRGGCSEESFGARHACSSSSPSRGPALHVWTR